MTQSAEVNTAAAPVFASVAEVTERLAAYGYIADNRLATTVFLLSRLGKPVLLEGPAGVGKTELAKSLAAACGRRLLRLQCYEGQDESKALYEWDYGKQLLYTQMLREKISEIVADAPDLASAVARIGDQDSVFFSDRFLVARPVLEAIRGPEPAVLLIDEIDRADEALEAVLLESLAEYQVSVPEIGAYTASVLPYVVLTSNNTRDLSAALKRRCLHLYLDYPDAARELEIVRSKHTGLPDALAEQLVSVVRELRGLRLRKSPGISETIDWAHALAVLGAEELDAQLLAETVNVVLKYERDLVRAREALPRLLPPGGAMPVLSEQDDSPTYSEMNGHAGAQEQYPRNAANAIGGANGDTDPTRNGNGNGNGNGDGDGDGDATGNGDGDDGTGQGHRAFAAATHHRALAKGR